MLGTDIVKISRIKKMDLQAFAEKCFTDAERTYVDGKKDKAQTLAGMFAAKEAVVKALGSGFVKSVVYTDVEILHDDFGAPYCVVYGGAERLLADKGNRIFLSISHDGDYAVAVAMIR